MDFEIVVMTCCKKRSPHPRDGPWAWLVCFASTVIFGIFFGYLLSFGVFLPVLSKHFNASRGSTAWIGSLAIGFSFLCGPIAVKIIDLVGERTVCVCGGLVGSSLLVISSFVDNIMLLYFSHGILLGICGSFVLNSLLLIVRKYFKEKLPLAIGITSSGSSLGVLVLAPALQILIDLLGWRDTLRVMSGGMLIVVLLSLTYDPHIKDDDQTKGLSGRRDTTRARNRCCSELMYCSIWRSPRYIVGITSVVITHFGLFVPSIHLVRFAEDHGISNSKASLLFIYIGVCSTIIRVIIGKIINKRWLTPLQGIQLSAFIIGISMVLLTQAQVYYHFIIFAVFYGLGSGAFTTTLALFFLTCFDDVRKASVSLSTGLTMSSLTLFTGAPVAGFIADQLNSYIPAFYMFGGLVIFAGTVPFCLVFCRNQTIQSKETTDARLRVVGYRLAGINARVSLIVDDEIYV